MGCSYQMSEWYRLYSSANSLAVRDTHYLCFNLFTDLDPFVNGKYKRAELKSGKRIEPILPIQKKIDYYHHNG